MRKVQEMFAMSDGASRELYQEVILDHSQAAAELPRARRTRTAAREGYNPLCGDRATVFLRVEGDVVQRRELRGQRLLDLHRVGLDDDGAVKGKTLARGASTCSSASTSS